MIWIPMLVIWSFQVVAYLLQTLDSTNVQWINESGETGASYDIRVRVAFVILKETVSYQ
jgi:hypothetical protein